MTKTSQKHRRWQRRMRQFTDATKGVAELIIVRHDDPTLLLGVLHAEEAALRIAAVLKQFFATFDEPSQWTSGSPICLTCNHVFPVHSRPPAVIINVPFGVDWIRGECAVVCNALCPQCATASDDEIFAKASKAWGAQQIQEGRA